MEKVMLFLARGCGSGLLHPAPGTWGSLAALLIGIVWSFSAVCRCGLLCWPDWRAFISVTAVKKHWAYTMLPRSCGTSGSYVDHHVGCAPCANTAGFSAVPVV